MREPADAARRIREIALLRFASAMNSAVVFEGSDG
jgi:hypothetical protein